MSYSFGNDRHDGHQAKSYEYLPTWEKTIDYNPDHQRSSSMMVIEERGNNVLWLLQVKNLGAILLRTRSNGHVLEDKGVSLYTDQEIGWRR